MDRFTLGQIGEIADQLRMLKVDGHQVFTSVYIGADPGDPTYWNIGIGSMSTALVSGSITSPVGMICIPVQSEVKV